MAWYTNTSSAIVPQWKTFINTFQAQNTFKPQHNVLPTLQPHQIPIIKNIQKFLSNVSGLLNEIKAYNNEVTDFVKKNIYILMKESLRIILEIPLASQTQDRKKKQPIQALEFIEGLGRLPNIFNINIFNEELYQFFCKGLFHYFKISSQILKRQKESKILQSSLYKNYFFRLFEVPYKITETQSKMGVNYSCTLSSINMSSNMTNSISQQNQFKKLTFLETLIQFIDKNQYEFKILSIVTDGFETQSMMDCLSKILLMNGLYNYPFHVKQFVLKQAFHQKKQYLKLLTNKLNNHNSNFMDSNLSSVIQTLQYKIQNILELQFNIVNHSNNIYDGIKLFQTICHPDNMNDIISLLSLNVIWKNKNHSRQKNLVPMFVEQHLSSLLLAIVNKDYSLYNNSSETQPKVNMKQINEKILPLIITLKQLTQSNNTITKPLLKHLNIIKILYVMILNRHKYNITQTVVIKHEIFKVLIELCQKYHSMDVMVNCIMQIFKSIFQGESNIINFNAINTNNYQQIKKNNDLTEQKIVVQVFKSFQLIMKQIRSFKSHKQPLFGQFFKLAKIVKQYAKNYYSIIDIPINQGLSESMMSNNNNSINMSTASSTSSNIMMSKSNVNNMNSLQPIYKNEFIKIKSQEWYDFYKASFQQIQNNYLRDLGKFDEFDQMQAPKPLEYTTKRFCEQKAITQSQVINDKAQFQASIQNSIEILSTDKKTLSNNDTMGINRQNIAQQKKETLIELNFKKKKPQNKQQIKLLSPRSNAQSSQNKLSNKQDLDIICEPIKIQFKKKLSDPTSNQSQSQNDSNSEVSEDLSDNNNKEQPSFKDFMKKKMDQIQTVNQEAEKRRKSKTPTKFKSRNDSKTPPKMKKWGSSVTEQNKQSNSISPALRPGSITKNVNKNVSQQVPKTSIKIEEQDKLQSLKKKLRSNLPSQKITIIKVGDKVPKKYKERMFDPKNRDSRLAQWIRA